MKEEFYDKLNKWYTFHWLNGTITYSKGEDISVAAPFDAGALRAIDFWEEVKEIPDEFKEFRLISLDGNNDILDCDTLFVKQAKLQMCNGTSVIEVNICNHKWRCTVEESNFEIIFTQY